MFHHKAEAKTYFLELKLSSILMKEYKSQFNTLVITSRNLQYYEFTITKLLPFLPRPFLLFPATLNLNPTPCGPVAGYKCDNYANCSGITLLEATALQSWWFEPH